MNILYIGPFHQIDRWGMSSLNYLGMFNSIPNVNVIARSIQYNGLSRKPEKWVIELENKKALPDYDYIVEFTLPSEFVYKRNAVGITLVEPTSLFDRFWERKIELMPKTIVGSLQEKQSILSNVNVRIVPECVDEEIKYKEYNPPKIKELGSSYIFYWVGEYGNAACFREVFQAFHLEFARNEKAHLMMYFLGAPTKEFIDLVTKELWEIKKGLGKYKNAEYYREDTISIGTELDFIRGCHAHCDCYVDVNRGVPNWSMIREAELFGKAVILNKGNKEEPIIGHNTYSANNFWKKISVNDIRRQMRDKFENREINNCRNCFNYQYGGNKLNEILV